MENKHLSDKAKDLVLRKICTAIRILDQVRRWTHPSSTTQLSMGVCQGERDLDRRQEEI